MAAPPQGQRAGAQRAGRVAQHAQNSTAQIVMPRHTAMPRARSERHRHPVAQTSGIISRITRPAALLTGFLMRSSAKPNAGAGIKKPPGIHAVRQIFISYSHQDEAWKNRVVKQLGVLAHTGLDSWDDRRIAAGDDWRPEIQQAIERCDVAVLLISADFLTSPFIRDQEVPRLLQRRQEQGIRVIPLIVRPCEWRRIDWLKTIQARPIDGKELLGMTENTDPIRGERVIAAIDMPSTDDGGQLVPLALGTRNGVVKRWNRESPTTMDSWSVIDLKDDDEVLAAAEARDEDRLVFVSTDSSLLTFEAKNVRPQGRTAGGMAGIRLAEGCSVAAFAVVPDGKVTWNYEEGENGLFSASGAVVLTVAGDSEALPGTENGAAKVTPLEMYPTKGRGTGGVRSQRFLKGQDTLILAFVGAYPLHASTQSGAPVELPKPDMRRDGSGTDLSAPIAVVG